MSEEWVAVAVMLGVAAVLVAVRLVVKRAEYHHRQNLPEHAPCRVYRDRAPR